ncbi:cation:proton antiporter domain-containing protein [Rhodopirellula sallentina]|uniref:Glutathione-regulated potassium-efflux system protein kefB n=1 Tax=Rhodopirellula sallentina SM41 TaxID=1263870 RepID=M5U5M1_9BACT|nr:cation:proton antiporter [Rhodopirellula sallentina]EMI56579.1 glutathione-regulated potassium-efflux system protein kefB [Rhodopirellula sallentina SM41]
MINLGLIAQPAHVNTPAMEQVHALLPAILLLSIGICSIVLMRRLGLSPIVGYMLGGMLIGEHALGWMHENQTVHLLAELGVVFLLFDIGLHFSIGHIWDARRDIFGLGPIQIILCAVAFTGIALAFGYPFDIALVVGCALSLSSTAVVNPTLQQRQQNQCPVGRTSTAVLILQDVLAIFLLVLAASMGSGEMSGGEMGPGESELPATNLPALIGLAAVKGVVAFAASVVLGRYVLRPMFQTIARSKNEEVFTAIALLIVLSMAAASGWMGLSLTLGAFLGGMMLAETPFRHLIRTEAKPFRDLLMAFFFISIGMSLDWRVLLDNWWQIAAFTIVLIAVKSVAVSLAARAVGWSLPGSLQLGFLLAQGSEFVFVILSMGTIREAFGEQTVGIVFIGVALSLALTPTVAELGNRLARSLRRRGNMSVPKSETTPIESIAPVIIFGMNEVGRSVADALEAHQIQYEAVERDYEQFTAASVDGYRVAFGDLRDLRLAETMEMDQRSSIVLASPRLDEVERLIPIVKERFPGLTQHIAVSDEAQGERLRDLGMNVVVAANGNTSRLLTQEVLRSLGIDDKQVKDWMQRRDEELQEATT